MNIKQILSDLTDNELRFLYLARLKEYESREYILLSEFLDFSDKGIERLHQQDLIEPINSTNDNGLYDFYSVDCWEVQAKGLKVLEQALLDGVDMSSLKLPEQILNDEYSKVFQVNNSSSLATLKNAWYKRIIKPNDNRIYNHGPFDSKEKANSGFQVNNIIQFNRDK